MGRNSSVKGRSPQAILAANKALLRACSFKIAAWAMALLPSRSVAYKISVSKAEVAACTVRNTSHAITFYTLYKD